MYLPDTGAVYSITSTVLLVDCANAQGIPGDERHNLKSILFPYSSVISIDYSLLKLKTTLIVSLALR